ncbi:unnamed protein product [Diamesa serratosioi]
MFKKNKKTPVLAEASLNETSRNETNACELNSDESYTPKIFRFCLPMDFAESILCWNLHNFDVVSPSYPVLLNHTIGVLWYLFEESNNINLLVKSDITWALRFLEQINTSRMSDTRDLKTLIHYLRNVLTVKYASEDETKVEELETTFIDKNTSELPYSHSIQEYDNSFDVQQMLKDEENRVEENTHIELCGNKELIRRLRELQNIQPEDKKIETIDQLFSLLDQTIF